MRSILRITFLTLSLIAINGCTSNPSGQYGGDPVRVVFDYKYHTNGEQNSAPVLRRWVMTGQTWFEVRKESNYQSISFLAPGSAERKAKIQDLVDSLNSHAIELDTTGAVKRKVPQGPIVYLLLWGDQVHVDRFNSLAVDQRHRQPELL